MKTNGFPVVLEANSRPVSANPNFINFYIITIIIIDFVEIWNFETAEPIYKSLVLFIDTMIHNPVVLIF